MEGVVPVEPSCGEAVFLRRAQPSAKPTALTPVLSDEYPARKVASPEERRNQYPQE